jgi:hypothetical protein
MKILINVGWDINLKLIFRLPEQQQNSYWRGGGYPLFDFCFDSDPWCAIVLESRQWGRKRLVRTSLEFGQLCSNRPFHRPNETGNATGHEICYFQEYSSMLTCVCAVMGIVCQLICEIYIKALPPNILGKEIYPLNRLKLVRITHLRILPNKPIEPFMYLITISNTFSLLCFLCADLRV